MKRRQRTSRHLAVTAAAGVPTGFRAAVAPVDQREGAQHHYRAHRRYRFEAEARAGPAVVALLSWTKAMAGYWVDDVAGAIGLVRRGARVATVWPLPTSHHGAAQ
jgi:hypothetical protein